jgi:RHS repeat-associated protein
MFPREIRRFLTASVAVCLSAMIALASSATDQGTPTALERGSKPYGNYGGGEFDKINLFNGNLSLTIPVLVEDGRAGTGLTLRLAYNSKIWRTQDLGINEMPSPAAVYSSWDQTTPELAHGWSLSLGRMVARQTGVGEHLCGAPPLQSTLYESTMTQFTFSAPDGTEYHFRDDLTDGNFLDGCQPVLNQGGLRGRVFHATDGTAATFISDADVRDDPTIGGPSQILLGTGYIYLRDGTRYRVDDGDVTWIQDRNGNRINIAYTSPLQTDLYDTRGRHVRITYTNANPTNNSGDVAIAYVDTFAFGTSTVRRRTTVKAHKLWVPTPSLNTAIRPDRNPGHAPLVHDLFPLLHNNEMQANDPPVLSAVELPSGDTWRFQYNEYGEMARVMPPTGGTVDYDSVGKQVGSGLETFRRVSERRAYTDNDPTDEPSVLATRTTYSDPTLNTPNAVAWERFYQPNTIGGAWTVVNSSIRHDYNGSPLDNYGVSTGVPPFSGYSPWMQGKELTTTVFSGDGATRLKKLDYTWEQRAAVVWAGASGQNDPVQPENDPRLTQQVTTFYTNGSSPESVTVKYTYDEYNNVTKERTYGVNAAGSDPIQQVDRVFMTDASYVGLGNASHDPASISHLRSLVKREIISRYASGTPVEEARTEYEYDVYSGNFHAGLTNRAFNPNGDGTLNHSNQYDTLKIYRGNATKVTRTLGTAAGISTHNWYDIAGNVVKTILPRATTTTLIANNSIDFDYYDGVNDFDDETFTYVKKTTRRVTETDLTVQTLTTSMTHDLNTGQVTSSKGYNGETTTYQYVDQLDRLTKVVRPAGFGETQYSYSGAGDFPAWGKARTKVDASNNFKEMITFYDGLGRPTRTTSSDPNGGPVFVQTDTEYDALGRPWLASNPHLTSDSTSGWTRTLYDGLGRVTSVGHFNGPAKPDATATAHTGSTTSLYAGYSTTNTDQAGNARRSTVDALGRVVTVVEDPGTSPHLNYTTTYLYDARGNLRKSTQGTQSRYVSYDEFSRVTMVRNVEQGTNSAVVGTDSITGNSAWTVGYSYDVAGNMTQKRDARNVVTNCTYDEMNRLRTKDYLNTAASPDVTHYYDDAAIPAAVQPPAPWTRGQALGRSVGVVTAATTETGQKQTGLFYGYDQGGHITRFDQLIDGVHFQNPTVPTFNELGQLTGQTYPSGTQIGMTYNKFGWQTGVTRGGSPMASGATYTEWGALSQQTLGNGLFHTMGYNARFQTTSIKLGTTAGGNDRLQIGYTYGVQPSGWGAGATIDETKNNGNLARQTIFPGSGNTIEQDFAYDGVNRLTLAREYYQGSGGQGSDTPGTFVASTATWNLRNSLTPGVADVSFGFGAAGTTFVPIKGDWDGDGDDTPGFYDPVTSTYFLRNANAPGAADITVGFGPANAGWKPIAGDWDGDGDDTIGAYDPATGNVFMRNSNAPGTADITFSFGAPNPAWQPLAGDWDGDGDDTIGLYNPATSTFSLRNVHAGGVADVTVAFGAMNSTALAGDWNNFGMDTIGTYVAATGVFNLRNTNTPGVADVTVGFGAPNSKPLVGDWDAGPAGSGGPQLSWAQGFLYDQWGNRTWNTAETNGFGQGPLVTINQSTNRIATLAGFTCTYLPSGSMTSDGTGRTYGYDANEKMYQATIGSTTTTYVYDGLGQRVESITGANKTRYVYDSAGLLIAEYTTSTTTPSKEYIYGPAGLLATVESSTVIYPTPDNLGTPRILTKADKSAQSRHDYMPFGEEIGPIGGRTASGYGGSDTLRRKFTGKERDPETGLDYFGPRYYGAFQGRFLSPDSVAGTVNNPQSHNRYAYVLNNPLRLVDPTGNEPKSANTDEEEKKTRNTPNPPPVVPTTLVFPILRVDEQGNAIAWDYELGVEVKLSRETLAALNDLYRSVFTTVYLAAVEDAIAKDLGGYEIESKTIGKSSEVDVSGGIEAGKDGISANGGGSGGGGGSAEITQKFHNNREIRESTRREIIDVRAVAREKITRTRIKDPLVGNNGKVRNISVPEAERLVESTYQLAHKAASGYAEFGSRFLEKKN